MVDAMTAERRLSLVAKLGAEVNFGPGCEIASDSVMLVYDGAVLVGWADDYGAMHHPDHALDPDVLEAAERLVSVATDLWVALDRPTEAGEPPNIIRGSD
jgi:hypothetical protein